MFAAGGSAPGEAAWHWRRPGRHVLGARGGPAPEGSGVGLCFPGRCAGVQSVQAPGLPRAWFINCRSQLEASEVTVVILFRGVPLKGHRKRLGDGVSLVHAKS